MRTFITPAFFLVRMVTAAFGSVTVVQHAHCALHDAGHASESVPSQISVLSRTSLPQVETSHTSPTPSPSVSVWSAGAAFGQLSMWSGTPSPSGLAGTMPSGSHELPGEQSSCDAHTPVSRAHELNEQCGDEAGHPVSS